jgi:Lrp/AsnC family leucine-responsive transcriptional regulator
MQTAVETVPRVGFGWQPIIRLDRGVVSGSGPPAGRAAWRSDSTLKPARRGSADFERIVAGDERSLILFGAAWPAPNFHLTLKGYASKSSAKAAILMRAKRDLQGLDEIDRRILGMLQTDCKVALAKLGEQVGLSAPSVVERVRKLENEGFVTGYHARLSARRLGLDVTAFISVWTAHPRVIQDFERQLGEFDDVLECHHVTGEPTLLLKVKTRNTQSLERLISALRSLSGVERTETNVVLSTLVERAGLGKRALRGDSDLAGLAHEKDTVS